MASITVPAGSSMSHSWWHDMPLRQQLMVPITIAVAVAILVAIVVLAYGAPQWSYGALLALWLAISAPCLLIVYAVLAWRLQPLEAMARVAEQEDPSEHLAGNTVAPELALIAGRINHLLAALSEAKSLNVQLHHNASELQEAERRRIANELHDEAGPCLFGISANLSSIRRIADGLEGEQSEKLLQRVAEIDDITSRLKSFNRDMLRALHPVQLGQVPLSDAVSSLVSGFRRQHPDTVFTFEVDALADGYGKDVDLAIYRAVQEAITNALRHGDAGRVDITLSATRAYAAGGAEQANASRLIRLNVRDNGSGVASQPDAGIGLTAMRDRARGLGGSVAIENVSTGGTDVTVTIPVVAPMVDGPRAG
ncbi:hypothetical protein C6Y62_04570 [Hyphomicrobium sulfonivorans]|nr:hypothetical protein [Hyphomicrobium sulfonivorans]